MHSRNCRFYLMHSRKAIYHYYCGFRNSWHLVSEINTLHYSIVKYLIKTKGLSLFLTFLLPFPNYYYAKKRMHMPHQNTSLYVFPYPCAATPVSISTCPKSYDQSKVPVSYLKSSSPYLHSTTTTSTNSTSKTFPAQQQQQQVEKWWDSLALPG